VKRDAWYAAIAAAGLCCAAGIYGLIAAPSLADPDVTIPRSKLTAALPSPPKAPATDEVLAQAKIILRERDPFIERADGSSTASGLDLPKLGLPVQFSDPEAQATVEPNTGALQPVATIPQTPVPQQTTQPAAQGNLTLRGVFPSPNGGRALVAMPDGRVVSVGVGGIVGGWRVLQIQQGAIRLGRGQRAILLAMPR